MSVENKTEKLKQDLRRLVAGDKLKAASQRLMAATTGDEYGDYRSRVLNMSGMLQSYQQQQLRGTEDYDTLTRSRNKISLTLLGLIDELPDEAALAAQESGPLGISENTLKKRVFWLLLGGKIIVLAFAFFQYDTGGGITSEGMLTVLGILIPMFGAYLTLAFQDVTRNRNVLKPEDIRVNKAFARRTYLVVIMYPFILCGLLYLRALGIIASMAGLTAALGLAESGWGVYVGKVIMGLFSERDVS